jgi:hypothetical protein
LDSFEPGLLANAAIYAFILSMGSKLSNQREFAETYKLFTSASLVTAMIVGGVLVGILVAILSSTLAMEKYLRLKKW